MQAPKANAKAGDQKQVASSCFELLHNEFVNQVCAHDEPLVAQFHLDAVGESVG